MSVFLIGSLELSAQKQVWLTGTEPYRASLKASAYSAGDDTRLCISFNEDENTLTVSLKSESVMLFAFRDAVIYRDVFKGCNRLRPDLLPYKVTYDTDNVIRMRGYVKRMLGRRPRHHLFSPWIACSSMDAVKAVCTMPEDSLVQVFKINPAVTNVTVRLSDIMVLKRKGPSKSAWKKMFITEYDNLNTEYDITIARDACRGKDDQIAAVAALHKELSSEVKSLVGVFPSGVANSLQGFDEFNEIKGRLLSKFIKKDTVTTCSTLRAAIKGYNKCVDSLLAMTCTISPELRGEFVNTLDPGDKDIDAQAVLNLARQLDELTSRWNITSGRSGRLDIRQRCDRILKDAERLIVGHRMMTEEDYRAVDLFRQAREYYLSTCK